jgi:ABC-type lipoprotein export system ATPase subunit
MTGLALRTEALRHIYRLDAEPGQTSDGRLIALDGVDLVVNAGSSVAIIGPSGSGKSTLMTLIAGLQRPTSGRLFIGEHELTTMSERDLLRVRANQIGVAVQNPNRNLLPYANSEENLRFAQRGARSYRRRDLPEPSRLLAQLGLTDLAGARADLLSGGERQRLALAATMATAPGVLLADEPTSALDTLNRDRVLALLQRVNTEFGTTVVTITHDPQVAAAFGRTVQIADGRITEIEGP